MKTNVQNDLDIIPDVTLDELLYRIGYKFYISRHSRRETIDAVANNLGISSSMISKIENGRYQIIKFEMIYLLAQYYGLQIDQLLCFEESKPLNEPDMKHFFLAGKKASYEE